MKILCLFALLTVVSVSTLFRDTLPRLSQRVCYYVPRRCRAVLVVCCVLLTGFTLLLAMHTSAVLFGRAVAGNPVGERSLKGAISLSTVQRTLERTEEEIATKEDLLQAKRRLVFELEKDSVRGKGTELEKVVSNKEEEHRVLVGRFSMPVTVKNDNIKKVSNSCPTLQSNVLFFMRLPKSASTSFVDLLKGLAQRSRFGFQFNPSGAYNWEESEKLKVANFVQHSSLAVNGFVYARHFYYVDFSKYQLKNHTYVTVLRHPVSRFVSSYLYYHFSSKPHIQAILKPEHRNESLEECLRFQHSGCTHNLMTKYFCGHELYCKTGSEQALTQAKKNLLKFAVVGIVEEMETSLLVFKSVLPRYFSSLDKDSLPRRNRNEHTLRVSENLRDSIARYNSADMQLYEFARQHLHNVAHKCIPS